MCVVCSHKKVGSSSLFLNSHFSHKRGWVSEDQGSIWNAAYDGGRDPEISKRRHNQFDPF